MVFLYALYRRIYEIARYSFGCESFVQFTMPYILTILGEEGVSQFIKASGGIVANWIVRSHRHPPRALYWASSPNIKVKHILGLNALALDNLEDHQYEQMAQRDEVSKLWTKGGAVTPILHSELQLIHYLEQRNISVAEKSVGMNQPPCWACYMYLGYMGTLARQTDPNAQGWRMSYTTGRARGSWMIPPGCPRKVLEQLLKKLDRRVHAAVEEYGFECLPEVIHLCAHTEEAPEHGSDTDMETQSTSDTTDCEAHP